MRVVVSDQEDEGPGAVELDRQRPRGSGPGGEDEGRRCSGFGAFFVDLHEGLVDHLFQGDIQQRTKSGQVNLFTVEDVSNAHALKCLWKRDLEDYRTVKAQILESAKCRITILNIPWI